jgi:hypothetical protein
MGGTLMSDVDCLLTLAVGGGGGGGLVDAGGKAGATPGMGGGGRLAPFAALLVGDVGTSFEPGWKGTGGGA